MAVDVNFLLLVVELVLLIPTLLLITLGRREEKARRQLLTQITNTARMVSRQEYFNSVSYGMQSATKYIKGSITGSAPKTEEQQELVEKIVDEIRRVKDRGVIIRYLLPKSQDRLTIASSYRQAGAEIRFHIALLVSDFRYVVIDGKKTVIGLPSTAGENQPTREGYLIPSEGMAEVFQQQFESKWSQAQEYDDYVQEILSELKVHSPTISEKLLSSQLQVPEDEVRRILKISSTQSRKQDDG